MFPTILTICQRISEIIKFIQPSDVKEIQNDNWVVYNTTFNYLCNKIPQHFVLLDS